MEKGKKMAEINFIKLVKGAKGEIVITEYVPVRHGRWIYNDGETIEDGGYCSECKLDMPMYREDWDKWEYCETNYCPHCGAKMKE